MTNERSVGATWPTPRFHFQVKWGSDSRVMRFQEVSGLDVEAGPIEFRRGDSPGFATTGMPGLKRHGNVTMKKGVFVSDNKFWEWLNQIKTNTVRREQVTISLIDESGSPTMVWTLTNAWPAKITGTDLKAEGNEVAVESLKIAHEGLTINSG